jgi:hypothetical protein
MAERHRIEKDSAHERERKPYTAPTLRRLGSVRDLTLGTTVGCASEANPKNPRKKGM